MREFKVANIKETYIRAIKELLFEMNKVEEKEYVLTVGNLRSLLKDLPDTTTLWVSARGHSIPIKGCHTRECTMPDHSEENSVQLVVSEEDVSDLI